MEYLLKYKETIFASILMVLFLITGFNNYNGALDKVGFQWLYLSLFNLVTILFFIFNKSQIPSEIFRSKIILAYFLFIIFGITSLLYTLNITESLLILSRWVICFFTLINITVLISSLNFDFKLISLFFLFILLGELFFSASTFFQIIFLTDYDFSYSNLLKGVTGNKNITSSILAIKLPFLLYLFHISKKNLHKFLLFLVYSLTIIILFALSSRAVYISLTLFSSGLFIFLLSIYSKKNIRKPVTHILLFHFFALIISFTYFQSILPPNSNVSLFSRAVTINTLDTSTNQRLSYYKLAINQVLDNPIVGVGLGNWKIESIGLDPSSINGYTVPYHVHNDFLEIATELGILGVILYISIFVVCLLALYKSYKKSDLTNQIFILMLFFSGLIYIVDSSLNFPYARVINQVMILSLLSLVIVISIRSKNNPS
tara:strand:- start:867 stop:2156 length:1290 start_codon:yes stop_codon:yes gene_type:complete